MKNKGEVSSSDGNHYENVRYVHPDDAKSQKVRVEARESDPNSRMTIPCPVCGGSGQI